MECSEPGAVRDEEIVAYLAGEAVRPSAVEHLTHCQHCSSRLTTYRRLELELLSNLYRWDCPPNQVLGEYQLGMLSQVQVDSVKNHLRTCMLCSVEVTTLTNFLTNDPMLVELVPEAQKVASISPDVLNNHQPAQTGSRLNVRETLDQLREQSLAGARRIIATLLPPQPRLAYQRNAGSQSALWPRRYIAEDVTVSVQVEQGGSGKERLQLIGFVAQKGGTARALQGCPVQLSTVGASGKLVDTQTIDELGNFVFSSLTSATYMLELQFPDSIVTINELSITDQE